MLPFFHYYAKHIRLTLHPLTSGALLTLAIQLSNEEIDLNLFLSWGAVLVGLSVTTEGTIHFARRSVIAFARTAQLFLNQVPVWIQQTEEIAILGGTLKSLTDQSHILEVLGQYCKAGKHVRILLMHPDSEDVPIVTRARGARLNFEMLAERYREEIRASILRLVSHLGADSVCKCLKLYSYAPTMAIHKYGKTYYLTCYTFGRGGSSPGLVVRRGPRTEEFCESLDRGFDELWANCSTLFLTPELIEKCRSISATSSVVAQPSTEADRK